MKPDTNNHKEIAFDKVEWWCGTVIIGAIPLLIRLAFSCFSNYKIEMLAIPEIVCFGFGIQISVIFTNIQALKIRKSNTTIMFTTAAIVFIIIFSIFYTLSLITPSPLNTFNSNIFLSLICLVSLYIGHTSIINAKIARIAL